VKFIKFTTNGKELAKFKKFVWRFESMYLLSIERIDIQTKTGTVMPFYAPLIRIERHPGQFTIAFYTTEFEHALTFQKMDPYVSYEKFENPSYEEIIKQAHEDQM
jgi:hypothetical protein